MTKTKLVFAGIGIVIIAAVAGTYAVFNATDNTFEFSSEDGQLDIKIKDDKSTGTKSYDITVKEDFGIVNPSKP